jgi:glycosyltransferase involved in cell wall biosynthesis
MTRVAHCIHGLDLGGAQQVVKNLVRGGARAGFSSVVYSPEGGVFAQEIADAGAAVHVVPRRLAKFDPAWVGSLARRMREDGVDLVHTHLFGDCLHGYLAARRAGNLPVVMTLHNVAKFHTGVQRLGYRWLLPRVARTVACSEAVRTSFAAEAGGRPIRLVTIANGIALDADAAREDGERTPPGTVSVPLVAGIGRLVEQKGFSFLIDAVARLWREGTPARLVLLGDGELREELRAQAAAAGVSEWVSLPGFRADVRALLPEIDVVAFSSLDEGLPIALLEAMAAARCVVSTDVGGIGDAVRHEQEALLVPPRDVAALAEALGRVLRDAALRRRLGAAAERRVRECYGAERMVDGYVRLYRDVLAERGDEPLRAAGGA